MKRLFFTIVAGVVLSLCVGNSRVFAQNLTVTNLGTSNPSVLVQNLMGIGVSSFTNVTYQGAAYSSGTFTGGSSVVGFDSGIILSNGAAASAQGPNSNFADECFDGPGDLDLANLAGVPVTDTYDATALSFDFVPAYNNITFQYVFASEEYNEYVGTQFNDVFGFFLNGTNVALVPGTSSVISINTVNNCTNPAYFIDNSNGSSSVSCIITKPTANLNTSMNGMTTILTVNMAVTPGTTNHIKLAICNVGDCQLDSNVFIKASSFTSGPTATLTPTPTATYTSTPTFTLTPCGYPGNTCTATDTPTITPTPIPADVFTLDKNVFSPSNPVSISIYYTAYPGLFELCIYNSAGELVKILDSQQLAAPLRQNYTWDGTNKYGDPCASGVYVIYAIEPYGRKLKRVILVR